MYQGKTRNMIYSVVSSEELNRDISEIKEVDKDVIEGALTNVPVSATPLTQVYKQLVAEMSVASIVILLSLLQL